MSCSQHVETKSIIRYVYDFKKVCLTNTHVYERNVASNLYLLLLIGAFFLGAITYSVYLPRRALRLSTHSLSLTIPIIIPQQSNGYHSITGGCGFGLPFKLFPPDGSFNKNWLCSTIGGIVNHCSIMQDVRCGAL